MYGADNASQKSHTFTDDCLKCHVVDGNSGVCVGSLDGLHQDLVLDGAVDAHRDLVPDAPSVARRGKLRRLGPGTRIEEIDVQVSSA